MALRPGRTAQVPIPAAATSGTYLRSPVREVLRSPDPRLKLAARTAHPCDADVVRLSTALVATGFDYDARVRARQATVLSRVLPNVRDIRRAGSAALDLSWCACGRYDAYFERGVKPWDYGAGGLIASRAGLELRRLDADGEDPAGVLAAPAALVDDLLALILGRT